MDCVVEPCDEFCGHCPIVSWGDPDDVCCTDTGLEGDELDAAIVGALQAATEIVNGLSGNRFGFRKDRFMPCRRGCQSCLCDPCNCCQFDKLFLPLGPVCGLTRFVVGGVDQDISGLNVQVDEFGRYFAVSCEPWPREQCQAAGFFEAGGVEPGCGVEDNWWVEYIYGEPVPVLGDWAVNALACQLIYSCENPKKCELPSGATNVSRQGVSFSVEQDSLALLQAGLTGLPAVDRFISVVNPYGLRHAPSFSSVDRWACVGGPVARQTGC